MNLEQKANELAVQEERKKQTDSMTKDNMVENSIVNKAKQSEDVKDIINLATTLNAINKEGTIEKLTTEKTEELLNDAITKKIKAESSKIKEQVEKVKQETEKELAELDKSKKRLQAEIEELKSKTDKASAFFNANKQILKCVGVRNPLSLTAMQWLMVPAGIIYTIFQALLLPLTLLGFCIEVLTELVGSVCGKIASNGWKIALSIVVIAVILALVGGLYYLGITYIF